jgi:hypothetical protein
MFVRPPTRPGLAVAALVCGIIGIPSFFLGVLPVLGLVFGLISARKIKRSNGAMTGLGMARAGWILGAIGVALFSLFIWAAVTGRLDDENDNSVFDTEERTVDTGDCLETLPEGEIVRSYDVIDCDEPHVGEVYLVESLAESRDEEYPGEAEAVRRTEAVCLNAFEEFVGRSFETSEFGVYYVTPLALSWRLDDDAVCIVVVERGTVTGTLEGADR